MEENLTRPVPDTGRLDLKNDYVFKRIFAKPENNAELKELTEAILNEKIKTIVVTNPEISKNYKDERLGVLDIRAYMNDDTEKEVLTYKVEYHYIELKKFLKKNPGISSKLEQWMWLIIGEEEKVEMVSKENKTIEKVVEDLDEMSADEKERWEAFNRKLAIWDYNVNIQMATEQGKEEEKEEMAKKLKKKGMTVEEIIEVTGLSKEKIESL